MKKIKLFPAPHVEIRISVSDEMTEDLKACRKAFKETDNGPEFCGPQCSWNDVMVYDECICGNPDVIRQVLGEEWNEQINPSEK